MKVSQIRLLSYAALWTFVAGCGTPQFGPAARELMPPLQTAISAQKLEWLDAIEKKLEQQLEAETLTDFELDTLFSIIEDCRSGNWKPAQKTLQTLMDGQRATADDVAELRDGESRRRSDERRKKARQTRRR